MAGFMGGWLDWWVKAWVNRHIDTDQIHLEIIKIIQFCLKIYDLWRHPHLSVAVWVIWWMGVLMGGSMSRVMSNHKYCIHL